MIAWLTQNIGTILVLLILIAIVAAVTVSMVRAKKKGHTSCGNGCAHSALHGTRHKK